MQVVVCLPRLDQFLEGNDSSSEQVKKAEIILSAFYAEHNVAFQTVEHLIPVLKKCFPDSKILQQVKLGRTKCTEVVKNVLAKHEIDKLITI